MSKRKSATLIGPGAVMGSPVSGMGPYSTLWAMAGSKAPWPAALTTLTAGACWLWVIRASPPPPEREPPLLPPLRLVELLGRAVGGLEVVVLPAVPLFVEVPRAPALPPRRSESAPRAPWPPVARPRGPPVPRPPCCAVARPPGAVARPPGAVARPPGFVWADVEEPPESPLVCGPCLGDVCVCAAQTETVIPNVSRRTIMTWTDLWYLVFIRSICSLWGSY